MQNARPETLHRSCPSSAQQKQESTISLQPMYSLQFGPSKCIFCANNFPQIFNPKSPTLPRPLSLKGRDTGNVIESV